MDSSRTEWWTYQYALVYGHLIINGHPCAALVCPTTLATFVMATKVSINVRCVSPPPLEKNIDCPSVHITQFTHNDLVVVTHFHLHFVEYFVCTLISLDLHSLPNAIYEYEYELNKQTIKIQLTCIGLCGVSLGSHHGYSYEISRRI